MPSTTYRRARDRAVTAQKIKPLPKKAILNKPVAHKTDPVAGNVGVGVELELEEASQPYTRTNPLSGFPFEVVCQP